MDGLLMWLFGFVSGTLAVIILLLFVAGATMNMSKEDQNEKED